MIYCAQHKIIISKNISYLKHMKENAALHATGCACAVCATLGWS
jgi:hypothetical protein